MRISGELVPRGASGWGCQSGAVIPGLLTAGKGHGVLHL